MQLQLNEGVIEAIRVDGNKETKDFVILREITLKPGDIFDSKQPDTQMKAIHKDCAEKGTGCNTFILEKKYNIIIYIVISRFPSRFFFVRVNLFLVDKKQFKVVKERFLTLDEEYYCL